jgi:hypothetical protein
MAEEKVQLDNQTTPKIAQILSTEHSTLQAARSALVVEANGRTASFLNAISAGVVALALVFNISEFGSIFLIFSMVLIPILGFIGISAYVRMVQIDLAEYAYTSAINRIHHFYLQISPEIKPFISFPGFDDERSISKARVIYTNLAWTVLSYPSGLILVINSLLAGALFSLLVAILFRTQVWVAVGAGAVIFLMAAVLQYRLGLKWLTAVREDFQPRFPEPESSNPQKI